MNGTGGRIVTFYSFKGGTGRTMALANTAWILAANGRRVLAVDWDLEAPGLHRFFQPFLDPATTRATTGVIDMLMDFALAAGEDGIGPAERPPDWYRDYARVQRHAVSLDWAFPEPGTLDLVIAGQQNSHYSAVVNTFEWDNFYGRLGGGVFFHALREDMRENYDYVLIDSRTGLTDIADICTAQLPDLLVDCFTLSNQSIAGAAAVARDLRDRFHGRPIRVLPVPMRIDEGEKAKADAGRSRARARFAGFPTGLSDEERAAYWGSVEIPYRPYYAFEETLATFGDEPGVPTSLLSAYERLTGVISDQEVTALPRMTEAERRHVSRMFARTDAEQPSEVRLCYAAADCLWAEWIEELLTRAGLRVLPQCVGRETERTEEPSVRTVLVLSPYFQRAAQWLWEAARGGQASGNGEVLAVRVGEVRAAPMADGWTVVDLVGSSEESAAAALLQALGRPPEPADLPDARFPERAPRFVNLASRSRSFNGRDALIERLRDGLRSSSVCALCGLGGVGKTQIALEYAHRFAPDYDLVWWVPAEQSELIAAASAELVARCQSSPALRWLLVLDNADDPEGVVRHLPRGGHILVTSRNHGWHQYAHGLEVEVFLREESVEHLRRRVADLSDDEADRIATEVGDLPLALEQAGAWLAETATPVDTYLAQLAEHAVEMLSLTQPTDYPDLLAATWNITIERLEQRSPAAVRLLHLCAFFSAEPIAVNLLYGDEMNRILTRADPELRERMLLGRLIRELGRFSLVKVDPAQASIQVHRLVQAVIRSRLTPEQQDEARHLVHRVLADARPSGDEPVDNPQNDPAYAVIWPHLAASGAMTCDEPGTRQLLIDRVRYLWRHGDLDRALSLGEELSDLWASEPDEAQLDLRFHIAAVLRSVGRYVEAAQLDTATLARRREVLADGHPHLLLTMGALAIDLGQLGRFDEALERATEACTGLRRTLGDDHPHTLGARHNQALCLRQLGRHREARHVDQEVYDRRRADLGADHPATLNSLVSLGRDLRELGEYADSITLLTTGHKAHVRLFGESHPDTLRAAKSLAVSLRRAGRTAEACELTRLTLDHHRALVPVRPTPGLLACCLNLASDLYATGSREQALTLAYDTVRDLQKVPGERHPTTLAAVNDLGVILNGCGDPAAARSLLERNLATLREVLGEQHPWTLTGAMNLGGVLGEAGEPQEAERLERTAVDGFHATLGADHPDTVTATANLAVTLRELGRLPEAEHLRVKATAELTRLLGVEHPHTLRAREGRRIRQDLEPMLD